VSTPPTATYDDVDPEDLCFSADGRRAAAWYVSRHREDRYDDDTNYQIVVWDAKTKEELKVFYRGYDVSHYTRSESGKPVVGIELSPDGRQLVIQYADESTEKLPLPD
jgi:hypothetical protein